MIPKDWIIVCIDSKMTPDELTEACFGARKKFNSLPSLASRLFSTKTNLKSMASIIRYLTYTTLFRKETFKKQDMHFGIGTNKSVQNS